MSKNLEDLTLPNAHLVSAADRSPRRVQFGRSSSSPQRPVASLGVHSPKQKAADKSPMIPTIEVVDESKMTAAELKVYRRAQKKKAKAERKRKAQLKKKQGAETEAAKGGDKTKTKKGKEKSKKPSFTKSATTGTPIMSPATSATLKKQSRPQRTILPQFDDPNIRKRMQKNAVIKRIPLPKSKMIPMFRHLEQYEREFYLSLQSKWIHPAVIRLGFYFADDIITGANARCVGMLNALKRVVQDYKASPHKEFKQDLLSKFKPCIQFLKDLRPLSVSMGNALRWLKGFIGSLPSTLKEHESKKRILKCIDDFIRDKIAAADEEICRNVVTRIRDGDVILTYARSFVVEKSLIAAHRKGARFRVVVVDSRPLREGRRLLANLVQAGVECTYTLIHGLSYAFSKVTKVFVGASTVLSNGYVQSRVGTAAVALLAQNYHIPVAVCCETYKFSDRVQIDAICNNEIGAADALTRPCLLSQKRELDDWREIENLKLLNLKYDTTPPQFITCVITEHGAIPPTSAPVIIREFHQERHLVLM